MRRFIRVSILALAGVLVLTALPLLAADAASPDLSGVWALNVDLSDNIEKAFEKRMTVMRNRGGSAVSNAGAGGGSAGGQGGGGGSKGGDGGGGGKGGGGGGDFGGVKSSFGGKGDVGARRSSGNDEEFFSRN